MTTSLRTKRRIFDLNRIILSILNKASNFDHKYDISFSPTQYKRSRNRLVFSNVFMSLCTTDRVIFFSRETRRCLTREIYKVHVTRSYMRLLCKRFAMKMVERRLVQFLLNCTVCQVPKRIETLPLEMND